MKWILLLPCLLSSIHLQAQRFENLVINGGFEEFSNGSCVQTANNTIREYTGWYDDPIRILSQDGSSSRTSPDSYNQDTCGTSPVWNNHVPKNVAGFQFPYSGNGYIGMSFQYTREFPSGTLSKDLQIGRAYCIQMYVSLAENFSTFATKDFQVLFHKDSVILTVPWIQQPGGVRDFMKAFYDTVTPITFDSGFLSDTVNWIRLEANFIATEEYKYFTIGNFKPHEQLDTLAIRASDVGKSVFTYYFIDDVSIFDCSDTIPPPEPTFAFEVKAYPNPASDWFNFDYTLPEAGKVLIHVTDVFGKIVLARTELQGQKGVNTFAIDATPWAMGRYHISVLYEANGQSAYRHLKMQVVR